jgi:hypothetical protein
MIRNAARFEYVLYLGDAYLSLPNKLYANDDVHLHRNLSKQRHVELPMESFGRSQGSDKVLSILSRLNV